MLPRFTLSLLVAIRGGNGAGGGGGGYGAIGPTGGTSCEGAGTGGIGGPTYGDAGLPDLYLGSGGGGGGFQAVVASGSAGADGGGIILIMANSITVTGGINSNGNAGSADANAAGEGGGGSGGSIKLMGKTLALGSSLVTASGGAGGALGGGVGGAGGAGRVAVFYTDSRTGTTSPGATETQSGIFPYGLYHSAPIPTANAVGLDLLRWESNLPANTKVEFQTRSGNSTDPTDGTWEDWKPFTDGTNFTMLEEASTASNRLSSSLNVNDTGIARNVDNFEDEDEPTAGNNLKRTTTGFEEDVSGTLTTSLVSYWTMNEASAGAGAVSRADSFGSETLTDNATTPSATGIKGNAINPVAANSEYLSHADSAALSTGAFSFSLSTWVKLTSLPGVGTNRWIATKYTDATHAEYVLGINNSGGTIRFMFQVFNSGGTLIGSILANNFGAPTTGVWYNVVASYDNPGATANIGVNKGTATWVAFPAAKPPADTTAVFQIGAIIGVQFLDGAIDEVGFWKKALSTQERTDLYDGGDASAYPAGGQYAEANTVSLDASSYDYITLWVRASQTGTVLEFRISDGGGIDSTENITIDAADTWQKVYWDLSDISAADRNDINALRITNLTTAANTIYLDNVRAEKLLTDSTGLSIPSTPNNYLQYRVILTTTDTSVIPELENVTLEYNNGYKVVQPDDDTVRLYNSTGTTQNVRLEAIVFGADLAEWYPTADNSIEAGDVVSIAGIKDDAGIPKIRKATSTSDPKMIGIISTRAGLELGIPREDRRLVGLAGRVPVKIAPDSAAIQAGDLLTSSGTFPGMATKLTQPGFAVAKALEDWSPESGFGRIDAFLSVSWGDPGVVVDDEGDAAETVEAPPTEDPTVETPSTPVEETPSEPEPITQKILPPKIEAEEGVFQRLTATIEAIFEKITVKIAQIAEAFIQKLTVESLAVKGKSTGQVIIEPGETEHAVEYLDLTESSKVFFTLDRAVAVGVEKTVGEGFKFILATPTDLPITIDYWVVEQYLYQLDILD